jgi:hypothetical protein
MHGEQNPAQEQLSAASLQAMSVIWPAPHLKARMTEKARERGAATQAAIDGG